MSRIRIKRTRVTILVVAPILLGGAAFGAYQLRRWKLDADTRALRDEGRVAIALGDHETGLDCLARYLRRFGGTEATSQDWLQYGRARLAVAMQDNAHVPGALAAFRKAYDLDPTSREARDELLDPTCAWASPARPSISRSAASPRLRATPRSSAGRRKCSSRCGGSPRLSRSRGS